MRATEVLGRFFLLTGQKIFRIYYYVELNSSIYRQNIERPYHCIYPANMNTYLDLFMENFNEKLNLINSDDAQKLISSLTLDM